MKSAQQCLLELLPIRLHPRRDAHKSHASTPGKRENESFAFRLPLLPGVDVSISSPRCQMEKGVPRGVLKSKKKVYHPKFPLERDILLVNGALVEVLDPGDCSLWRGPNLDNLLDVLPVQGFCAQVVAELIPWGRSRGVARNDGAQHSPFEFPMQGIPVLRAHPRKAPCLPPAFSLLARTDCRTLSLSHSGPVAVGTDSFSTVCATEGGNPAPISSCILASCEACFPVGIGKAKRKRCPPQSDWCPRSPLPPPRGMLQAIPNMSGFGPAEDGACGGVEFRRGTIPPWIFTVDERVDNRVWVRRRGRQKHRRGRWERTCAGVQCTVRREMKHDAWMNDLF